MHCRGPVIGVYSKQEAAALKRPVLAGHKKRKGCGADLAKLIAQIPQDGKDHDLKCPRCGNVSRVMRTPPTDAPSDG